MREEQPQMPVTPGLSVYQILAYSFTFIGGVAAIFATDKPMIIWSAWLFSTLVLVVFTVYVWRKEAKKIALLFASATVVMAGMLVGYTVIVLPFAPPVIAHNEQAPTSQLPPGTTSKPSATPQGKNPLVEGTVEIGINQAVDLDVPNAKAEFTGKLEPPHDLYVDEHTIPFQPQFLSQFTTYCVRTSEGRVATIIVTSGNLWPGNATNTVQLKFRVW